MHGNAGAKGLETVLTPSATSPLSSPRPGGGCPVRTRGKTDLRLRLLAPPPRCRLLLPPPRGSIRLEPDAFPPPQSPLGLPPFPFPLPPPATSLRRRPDWLEQGSVPLEPDSLSLRRASFPLAPSPFRLRPDSFWLRNNSFIPALRSFRPPENTMQPGWGQKLVRLPAFRTPSPEPGGAPLPRSPDWWLPVFLGSKFNLHALVSRWLHSSPPAPASAVQLRFRLTAKRTQHLNPRPDHG